MNRYQYDDSTAVPAYSSAAGGREAEDLFLYPLEKLTLKRGETALIPLFTVEMPYEHIYTWTIADVLDAHERYQRSGRASDLETEEEQVWHACRLTNTADVPLTTAPAQFIKAGQIVGQDLCTFTNPGGLATIRINRALKISAAQAEFEINRQRNVHQFQGYNYDKVTLRGELKLFSRMSDPVRIEVTKDLSGELGTAGDEPRVIQTGKGLRAANPRLQLVWKLDLEPGKERIVTYEYTVLIRQ